MDFDYLVQETGKVFHWDEDGRQVNLRQSHAKYPNTLVVWVRFERVAAEEASPTPHLNSTTELPRPSLRLNIPC